MANSAHAAGAAHALLPHAIPGGAVAPDGSVAPDHAAAPATAPAPAPVPAPGHGHGHRIIAVADDLSGAAEVAAVFASAHPTQTVRVLLDGGSASNASAAVSTATSAREATATAITPTPSPAPAAAPATATAAAAAAAAAGLFEADTIVVDTDSRASSPADAALRVRRILDAAQISAPKATGAAKAPHGASATGRSQGASTVSAARASQAASTANAASATSASQGASTVSATSSAQSTAELAKHAHPPLFYKKTDSLLRGHLAAEVTAVAAELPVIFCPALPAHGRTVVDGALLIAGEPLASTNLWHAEPGTPPNAIAELFGHHATTHLRLSDLRGSAAEVEGRLRAASTPGVVTIVDGETDADVQAAVSAALAVGGFAFAGTSAVAGALSRALHGTRPPAHDDRAAAETQTTAGTGTGTVADNNIGASGGNRAVLFAIASASESARSQLAALEGAGVATVTVSVADLLGGEPHAGLAAFAALRQHLSGELTSPAQPLDPTQPTHPAQPANPALPAQHPNPAQLPNQTQHAHPLAPVHPRPIVALRLTQDAPPIPQQSSAIVAAFADLVASAAGTADLVLAGGETARRILDRLNVTELRVVTEITPGVVELETPDGRRVVTKPGSYGDAETLNRVAAHLNSRHPGRGPRAEHPTTSSAEIDSERAHQ